DLFAAGAELMINTSASPFVVGKNDFRLALFASQVKQFRKALVYVNQVGGNDELVFDGNSVVIDADGNVLAQAKDFEEDLLVVDLPQRTAEIGKPVLTASAAQVQQFADQAFDLDKQHNSPKAIESIYKALVLGLRDYVRKCGFKSVVLGLSGGIDSALTAAL